MSKYVLKYKPLRFEQDIIDENAHILGYVNRYARHLGQSLFRLVDQSSVLNVRVENERRELLLKLEAASRPLAIKRRWAGTIFGNPEVHFHLTLIPELKIGFHMNLEINGRIISVKDRTLGTEPQFLDSENNVLARCHDSLTGRVHIDILDPGLDIYLVAAVAYLIRQY